MEEMTGTKEKMTITRALTELKTIEKRIIKLIEGLRVVDAYQNRTPNLSASRKPQESFRDDANASLNAINALIRQRKKIKDGIVKSNAETIIVINGEPMSVASAIEMKTSIKFLDMLRDKLVSNFTEVKNATERMNIKVEENLQSLMSSMFGSDKKTNPEMFEETAKAFRHQNQIFIFDPLGAEKKISELTDRIIGFTGEVDFALSESNATTTIEI